MACKLCLIDPKTDKITKSIVVDENYNNSEKEVLKRNEDLNRKGNKKGFYWKVTVINC